MLGKAVLHSNEIRLKSSVRQSLTAPRLLGRAALQRLHRKIYRTHRRCGFRVSESADNATSLYKRSKNRGETGLLLLNKSIKKGIQQRDTLIFYLFTAL